LSLPPECLETILGQPGGNLPPADDYVLVSDEPDPRRVILVLFRE
jgi:hypothetical protein